MQVRLRWARALAAVALPLTLLQPAHAAQPTWAKTYKAAVQKANTTHKLIMVDFYTDWCSACKMLDKEAYADPGIARQISTQFVPLKLNAEKEGSRQAKKYGVNGYPTILFLNAKGKVEGRMEGYGGAQRFRIMLGDIDEAHRALPGLEAKYKAHPTDLTTTLSLADLYTKQGSLEQASVYLTRAEKLAPVNKQERLVKTYQAVGDAYASQNNFDKAIPFFRKVVKISNSPAEQANANYSIASCYLVQEQVKPSIPYLKAVSTAQGAPDVLKKHADMMLAEIHKRGMDQ